MWDVGFRVADADGALGLARVRLNALIPLWLLRGRAYLKSRVASLVDLNVDLLPHNEEFVRFVRDVQRAESQSSREGGDGEGTKPARCESVSERVTAS